MSPKKRSPNNLTSTQLVLLSAAAQREDGAIELAPNLKGAAADKVVGKLLRDGLIEEIPAPGALPIWRREKEAVALRITKRGLAAIGIDEHRALLEAAENSGTWRSTDPACNKLVMSVVRVDGSMITDVAKWIHEVGMSPSELADALGLPRGQVSRLIVGEEEPDRVTEWALLMFVANS
jgi:hypothetical protein